MSSSSHPTTPGAIGNLDVAGASGGAPQGTVGLSGVPVSRALHSGVIDCPPQASVSDVASLMAEHNVHCVVVDGLARGPHHGEELVWGIVSDLDLVGALADGASSTQAAEIAATEPLTIDAGEDLQQAARVMAEHECSHLIVTGKDSRPVGVLSTLDIARALAWGSDPASHRPIVR